MTKEEAIELLEDLDGAIEDNHGRDYDEAFRMAIKSLSAEPSGGLISRQWLLDLYDIDTTGFKETPKVPLSVIIQNVKDAPSAVCDDCIWRVCNYNSVDWEKPSADRPKGEWIDVYDFVHLAWECSECGAITSVKTPFCYECGADMRGEKDD